MKFFRRKRLTDTDGFTITDSVKAKFRKEGSERFILLRNGVNLFRFDPRQFQRISVGKAEQGYDLLGHTAAGGVGTPTVLASFASARAAENAHAAVAAAYAGLGAKRRALRWLLVAVAAYAVLNLLFGAPKAVGAQSLGLAVDSAAQRAQKLVPAAGAAPQSPAGFSPSEPTLEDLAAGKYQFRPNISAPDVQPPDLSCATK